MSILIGAYFLNLFFQALIRRVIIKGIKNGIQNEEKKKRIQTLVSAFGGTTRFLIWIVAILMVLPEIGINIGPILASLGIAGFAIGMAAKDTVSDFISGFFILLEGQYKVGDKIKIGNIEGEVVDFNLRRTILKDENGFLHFFPNSQIKIVARKIK
ncbi:mechanosensitive ion channel [Candidatus Parcubacteria bacterium]|nr:mechanosensitive ion channel [Candidatus Parcubacteria bacterium]